MTRRRAVAVHTACEQFLADGNNVTFTAIAEQPKQGSKLSIDQVANIPSQDTVKV